MERAEDLDASSQVLHPGYPERKLEAIVANKLGKPLNELRFKSIKEVK